MDKEKQKLITDIEDPEKKKAREQEKQKAEERAKKRKLIPPFVMLLAGAATSISLYLLNYKLKDTLVILFWVLIIFYIAGCLIKWMLERFEMQIEQSRIEEGEVIEEELDEAEGVVQSEGSDE